MKVIEESKHYVVVQLPRVDINSNREALELLESLINLGLKPLHPLLNKAAFVCEKTVKYKPSNSS